MKTDILDALMRVAIEGPEVEDKAALMLILRGALARFRAKKKRVPGRGNPGQTREVKKRRAKPTLRSVLSSEMEIEYEDVLEIVRNAARFVPTAGQVVQALPPSEAELLAALKGKRIAHRWDGEHGGWFIARVKKLETDGDKKGKWRVRYFAGQGYAASIEHHSLKREENGADKIWVLLAN